MHSCGNIIFCRFKKRLHSMVNMSDKIGYIYWFCVLFTISFGGAAGIYTSIKNKTNMELMCNQKLDYYVHYLNEENIAAPPFNDNEAVMSKVNKIENELMYVIYYHICLF